MIDVFEVSAADEKTLGVINNLIPQLSQSATVINEVHLRKIVETGTTKLFLAQEKDIVLGMLTLVLFSIPTGTKAWVEDVVVDQSARGKGVGVTLMNHALGVAKNSGATSVDLTSRPSREAANQLYKKLGFVTRETNVYRFKYN
ncbi:MAG: GNAT family N-acetyltransferase [Opitutales bacterium]|nr:GNAT family N-acetyltransferase [Opitutales bacterium]